MSVAMRESWEKAKAYDDTLTADDPRFNHMAYICHEDGSIFLLQNAFVMDNDPWLWVFTEHQGMFVFAKGDLVLYTEYKNQVYIP